nr:hypothetical protein [Paludibacteraceae bacterium]
TMTKKDETYIFSKTGKRFVGVEVMTSVMLFLLYSVMFVWMYVKSPPSYIFLLLIAVFALGFPAFLLYCRYYFMKYDEPTIFSINIKEKSFTYQREDKKVVFHANEIAEWWRYRYGPVSGDPMVQILEFRLKNGESVFVSNDADNIRFVLYKNKEILELPEEEDAYALWRLYSLLKRILPKR